MQVCRQPRTGGNWWRTRRNWRRPARNRARAGCCGMSSVALQHRQAERCRFRGRRAEAMADAESLAARIEKAIHVDEVGIETGRFGPYFLKTMYQPVFRNTGEQLVPSGVEGLVGPHKDGQQVGTRAFFSDVAAASETLFVENLCHTLHLHNYPNIGVDGLMLFIKHYASADFGLEAALEQIEG